MDSQKQTFIARLYFNIDFLVSCYHFFFFFCRNGKGKQKEKFEYILVYRPSYRRNRKIFILAWIETLPNVNIRDPRHDKNLSIKREKSLHRNKVLFYQNHKMAKYINVRNIFMVVQYLFFIF